jgi:spore coat protein U-like protein
MMRADLRWLAACAATLVCFDAHGLLPSCSVANATLAFGTYNPVIGTPTTANASITVTCSAVVSLSTQVPYTLLLSAGSGTITNRKMVSGANSLPYNIYTTSSYTTVWDNTTGVSGNVTVTPLLGQGTDTQIAYGRILAMQPVPVGMYIDTLVITVNF